MIWFAPISIIIWALELAVEIVLWFLGWIVVPILAARGNYFRGNSPLWPDRVVLQWSPRLSYIWGNDEDGIDGMGTQDTRNDWKQRTAAWSTFRRIVVWSCWRNPTGNLRFVRPFGFLIDPAKVKWRSSQPAPIAYGKQYPHRFLWHYARCGLYTGVWFSYLGVRVRIGWKIHPGDEHGLEPQDYRRKGCGFALQFQRNA